MNNISDRKACTKCGDVKSLTDFHKSNGPKAHKSGYMSWCKDCNKQNRKRWTAKRKEEGVVVIIAEKLCVGCGTIRPTEDFTADSISLDGFRAYCKECGRTHSRKSYQKGLSENPVALKAREMVLKARQKSSEERLPFDIDREYLLSVMPTICPVLGIPLNFTAPVIEDASPTLDKFYPHKGYVKGNVTIISRLANLIKSKATTAQVQQVADWMTEWEENYDGDEDTIRLDGGISITSKVAGTNVSAGSITSTSP